jgi:hypothetical protein
MVRAAGEQTTGKVSVLDSYFAAAETVLGKTNDPTALVYTDCTTYPDGGAYVFRVEGVSHVSATQIREIISRIGASEVFVFPDKTSSVFIEVHKAVPLEVVGASSPAPSKSWTLSTKFIVLALVVALLAYASWATVDTSELQLNWTLYKQATTGR